MRNLVVSLGLIVGFGIVALPAQAAEAPQPDIVGVGTLVECPFHNYGGIADPHFGVGCSVLDRPIVGTGADVRRLHIWLDLLGSRVIES